MDSKKRFVPLFPKPPLGKNAEYRKKQGVFHRKRKVLFFSAKTLALLLFLLSVTATYAKAPTIQHAVNRAIQTVIAPLKQKPKPLIQSDQVLSAEIQNAIETLARQEIKQEQANATLPFTTISETEDENVFEQVLGEIEEFTKRDPVDQARLRIKKINRLITNLKRVLSRDKSSKAIEEAVGIIQQIGTETDKIVVDPKVQTDREILTLQIEQYNRLQLMIQQLEDRHGLSFYDYLKIEDARQKYLVATAVKSINAAPSLEVIHTIALPVIANFVGEDFMELKALEVITDFENKITPQAKQKLLGLEKELVTSFEKKMLRLPRDIRNRKLQSYIHYSFGDPILQIQAFERVKNMLSDREMILGVDSLKEVAIAHLTHHILELETKEDIDKYLDRVIGKLQDIKVLTQIQLFVKGGRDQEKIKKFTVMEQTIYNHIGRFLNALTPDQLPSFFIPEEGKPIDLIDVVMITNMEATMAASSEVSNSVKEQFSKTKKSTIERFIQELSSKEFLTNSRLAYNPASESADVRVLLSNPQGIVSLQSLRSQVPPNQRRRIDTAIRANSTIIHEHLLFHVNDPDIFADYEQFITQNTQVNQALRRYVGRNFADNIAKKSQVVQQVALAEKQQLYEVMQQITQSIFANQDTSEFEKQLPESILPEISSFKQTLPARNIPKLTLPEGINLPTIASLPNTVENAIVQAAKARIREREKSEAIKLDFTLTAADLDISQPRILPDSLFYPVKHVFRRAQLLLIFDPLSRVELLVRHNNERTLEAATLLAKSSSRKSVNLALDTLNNVEKDFNRLKAQTGQLDALKQKQPERVDRLIDSIIKNGLARQIVFALIEDKVYGADYVRVEKIRQSVLRDGIDSLLQLSGGNAQVLVEKLEKAVNEGSGSKFKELKAIELLTEIKRFQPEKIGEVLEASGIRLVKQFEAKLLAMDKEERDKELLAYADGLPGNPVRQFQAYEELRESFENKEIATLVYSLEDKAIENLTEIVSSITDETTLQEFAQEVVGSEPEDLKIIIEVELHVDTPDALAVVQTPIEQKIDEIKTIVEEQIVEEFIENPQSLLESDLFSDPSNKGNTSVTDVEVVQELVEIIEQTPQATPELVEAIEELEQEVVSDFIETVTTNPIQALEPAPEVIETLVELKEETPPAVDAQIDAAIEAEVEIIQEQLTTEVTTPETLETYISQITDSPVVAEVIGKVGGSEFTQVLEETTTELAQTTTQQQSLLQETITQIQQEIFTSPVYNPAPVEQTLPQAVQTEITQIKGEVSTEQVLQTTVSSQTTVTVEAVQTSTQTQTEVTSTVEQAAPTTESAPSAPEPAQETQTTTTETPSAETPAVPGL